MTADIQTFAYDMLIWHAFAVSGLRPNSNVTSTRPLAELVRENHPRLGCLEADR